jgi:hypothetical protein
LNCGHVRRTTMSLEHNLLLLNRGMEPETALTNYETGVNYVSYKHIAF